MRALLAAGADLDARCEVHGHTALHLGARKGNARAVAMLLQACYVAAAGDSNGGDGSETGGSGSDGVVDGDDALMAAVKRALETRCAHGETAVDIARDAGQRQLAESLADAELVRRVAKAARSDEGWHGRSRHEEITEQHRPPSWRLLEGHRPPPHTEL